MQISTMRQAPAASCSVEHAGGRRHMNPQGATQDDKWLGALRALMAACCLGLALFLWLVAANEPRAATSASAQASQGATARVTTTIEWGSTDGCQQNFETTTAAFGDTMPAEPVQSPASYTACVGSNATWTIT